MTTCDPNPILTTHNSMWFIQCCFGQLLDIIHPLRHWQSPSWMHQIPKWRLNRFPSAATLNLYQNSSFAFSISSGALTLIHFLVCLVKWPYPGMGPLFIESFPASAYHTWTTASTLPFKELIAPLVERAYIAITNRSPLRWSNEHCVTEMEFHWDGERRVVGRFAWYCGVKCSCWAG